MPGLTPGGSTAYADMAFRGRALCRHCGRYRSADVWRRGRPDRRNQEGSCKSWRAERPDRFRKGLDVSHCQPVRVAGVGGCAGQGGERIRDRRTHPHHQIQSRTRLHPDSGQCHGRRHARLLREGGGRSDRHRRRCRHDLRTGQARHTELCLLSDGGSRPALRRAPSQP